MNSISGQGFGSVWDAVMNNRGRTKAFVISKEPESRTEKKISRGQVRTTMPKAEIDESQSCDSRDNKRDMLWGHFGESILGMISKLLAHLPFCNRWLSSRTTEVDRVHKGEHWKFSRQRQCGGRTKGRFQWDRRGSERMNLSEAKRVTWNGRR